MPKKKLLTPQEKAIFKLQDRLKKEGTSLIRAAQGSSKVAAPGGPAATLIESINLGYGLEIDSIDFIATDQGYFNVAAQLTLAVRPAFRSAVEHLRKVIPEMVKEKLDKSRVIQDLKNQESELVAALGLANSVSSADALVNHIVKSVRVRITTTTEAIETAQAKLHDFQVPQILWGISGDKLMSVGEWGNYPSYPSRESINWAMWLLQNSYRSSGHRIKFGSFSGRQSRTRRAIMIPGGSFSLRKYIDPYEVSFVEDIIDTNLQIRVQQIAEKIITQEIAKVPEMEIGRVAGGLQLRAGKAVHISAGDETRSIGGVVEAGELNLDITGDILAKLQELAATGDISKEDVLRFGRGEIDLKDLLGG